MTFVNRRGAAPFDQERAFSHMHASLIDISCSKPIFRHCHTRPGLRRKKRGSVAEPPKMDGDPFPGSNPPATST